MFKKRLSGSFESPSLPFSADRAKEHQTLKSCAALLSVLDELRQAAKEQAAVEKRLARAIRDVGSNLGDTAAGRALLAEAELLSVLADKDKDQAGRVASSYERINTKAADWFKRVHKEERAHDSEVDGLSAKLAKLDQSRVGSTSKRVTVDERYLGELTALSGAVSAAKARHTERMALQTTATTNHFARELSVVAEAIWKSQFEGARCVGQRIGDVMQRALWCEVDMPTEPAYDSSSPPMSTRGPRSLHEPTSTGNAPSLRPSHSQPPSPKSEPRFLPQPPPPPPVRSQTLELPRPNVIRQESAEPQGQYRRSGPPSPASEKHPSPPPSPVVAPRGFLIDETDDYDPAREVTPRWDRERSTRSSGDYFSRPVDRRRESAPPPSIDPVVSFAAAPSPALQRPRFDYVTPRYESTSSIHGSQPINQSASSRDTLPLDRRRGSTDSERIFVARMTEQYRAGVRDDPEVRRPAQLSVLTSQPVGTTFPRPQSRVSSLAQRYAASARSETTDGQREFGEREPRAAGDRRR